MDEKEKQRLINSMFKKAAGYEAIETQEEYSLVDGELALTKRKIIRKDVPPDLSALKILLADEEPPNVSREELERERNELEKEYFKLVENRLNGDKKTKKGEREQHGTYRKQVQNRLRNGRVQKPSDQNNQV